ncbi:MAG TPA: TFIIB-type zinc ribbon-containing protein [Nitrososphaera sp.]|nr:TFIIB-type zinc ribbon-containing protein [Nitrososphaera sp.]
MQAAIVCNVCESGQTVTDPESGEIICGNCGLVLFDKTLESRPEWRAFTTEEANDRSRTGIPSSLARHDMGLSTVIGKADRDASGRVLDVTMRSTMGRLRAWDFRSQAHSPTDRNLRQAFSELDRLKDKLGVSDAVIEKTAYIYRKAQERGLVRGRTISAMVGAALYIACRETGASRTLKDIAEIGNIKRKDLARIYRLVVTELDLKIPMIDPMKCIVRVANRAKLSERTKRVAMNIMKDVIESGISAGKDPMGLAASVLYLACLSTGESRTQTDIAEAAGVTEVTVRNRYKNLKATIPLRYD